MDGLALNPTEAEYEVDFHAWALDQARRLRHAKIPGLDTQNIAEEIESLGRNDRRELARRLGVLLTHLLKWQFQPERRGESWIATIGEQRRSIEVVLDESPSLRPTRAGHPATGPRFCRATGCPGDRPAPDAFPALMPMDLRRVSTQALKRAR